MPKGMLWFMARCRRRAKPSHETAEPSGGCASLAACRGSPVRETSRSLRGGCAGQLPNVLLACSFSIVAAPA